MENMTGKLVIISGPSGAGKTSIAKHLINSNLDLAFSVSATTRQLRGNEKEGVDYFFLSVSEFNKRVTNKEFIEWEEVYNDILYGTLKVELERIWDAENHVLFDLDVNGGIKLKKKFGARSISIFIMPPSVKELENRLIRRATDSIEKIGVRIEKAREELKRADQFDHVVINNDLELAKNEVYKLVSGFLNKEDILL